MKIIRCFQIVLTLFYGQFISSSIFYFFIRTIPDLTVNPSSYFLASKGYYAKGLLIILNNLIFNQNNLLIKVDLSVLIFFTSIFPLIVIWRKNFKIIFLSAIFLLVQFLILMIITTIHLTLKYSCSSKLDRIKLITHVIVESLIQFYGIIVTFWMSMRNSFKKEYYGEEYKDSKNMSEDQNRVLSFLPISKDNENNDLDI